MEYNHLLAKLRKDIKELNLKRHKLKEYQLSILDFIEGKTSSSQYMLEGKIIQLSRGNDSFGFQHILKSHYQDNSNGKLNAREIINLWLLIDKGTSTTAFEQNSKGNYAVRYIKNSSDIEIRLMLIYFKDLDIYRVLTYYSDRNEEIGDLS